MKENIEDYFSKLTEVLGKIDIELISEAMEAILAAYEREATIYIFGNGGSAATASHFVCDFNKGICVNLDKKFNMICLNDSVSMITAIANDLSYEDIFCSQLDNKLNRDDLLIAISGSGNSKNIIKAVNYAKTVDCKVIGLTGYDGGELKKLADYHMDVGVDDMQITEDIHMVFDHMMYRVFTDYLNDRKAAN